MDRDKQSSKHTFGAWSDDPTKQVVDGWMASRRSVILVRHPDDSSLAGNGNSNCSSRFSSSSSRLGSAPNCGFRRITCSAVSRGPRRYSSCAAKVVVPHLTACWHSTLWRTHQHRTVFEAPLFAALRCSWMSSPCNAPGAFSFLCPWCYALFFWCSAHVQQKTVRSTANKMGGHEPPRTNETTTRLSQTTMIIERISICLYVYRDDSITRFSTYFLTLNTATSTLNPRTQSNFLSVFISLE